MPSPQPPTKTRAQPPPTKTHWPLIEAAAHAGVHDLSRDRPRPVIIPRHKAGQNADQRPWRPFATSCYAEQSKARPSKQIPTKPPSIHGPAVSMPTTTKPSPIKTD